MALMESTQCCGLSPWNSSQGMHVLVLITMVHSLVPEVAMQRPRTQPSHFKGFGRRGRFTMPHE